MVPMELPGASVPPLITRPPLIVPPPLNAPPFTVTGLDRVPFTTRPPEFTTVEPGKRLLLLRTMVPVPVLINAPVPKISPA